MSDFALAFLYPYIPVLVLLGFYLAAGGGFNDDDDDDGGKGMMEPAYEYIPASNPA